MTAIVQNIKRLAAYRRRKAPKVGTVPLFLAAGCLFVRLMRSLPSRLPVTLHSVPGLRSFRPAFSPHF